MWRNAGRDVHARCTVANRGCANIKSYSTHLTCCMNAPSLLCRLLMLAHRPSASAGVTIMFKLLGSDRRRVDHVGATATNPNP